MHPKHLLAAISTFALVTSASAQVLYSDSFTRITGSGDPNGKPANPNNFSSWGTNDNALGGTISQAWVVGPNRTGGANQVTDGALASTADGSAFYDFDATILSPSGFTVSFAFSRFHPFNPGTGTGFLTVGLGVNAGTVPATSAFTTNNADFALLFQQGAGANVGNTQFFQDGVFLPGTASTGPVDYGNPTIAHSVLLTFIPSIAGAYGATDTIAGSVSIDGGSAYNFSVLGGANFGALSFSSSALVHRSYDNVAVSAVPEPTSATLLITGCFCASLSRPRKRQVPR